MHFKRFPAFIRVGVRFSAVDDRAHLTRNEIDIVSAEANLTANNEPFRNLFHSSYLRPFGNPTERVSITFFGELEQQAHAV